MRSPAACLLSALCLLATPAVAQRVIATMLGELYGEFGGIVARAGDVNRDGVDDVWAMAPELTLSGSRAPRLFLLSGVDLSPIRVITGPQGEDWGVAIDGGEDFDGDQVPDVVVGVTGRVVVSTIFGAAEIRSGQTGAVLATYAPTTNGRRGHAVLVLPDLDRDNVPDFAVSDAVAGSIHVVSGRTRTLIRSAVLPAFGNVSSGSLQLRAAGDVNRDGVVDLIWGYPVTGEGRAEVLSGATGSTLYTYLGSNPSRLRLGHSVTGCNDVDGDGHADFAISSPLSRRDGFYTGIVEVFSGRTGTVMHTFRPGLPNNDSFGMGLTGVGDWNGDGAPDLAMAMQATWLANRSAVAIHSGRTGAQLAVFDAITPTAGFGSAMLGLGDVDRDGVSDLAVGTPLDSLSLYRQGSVRILSGRIMAQATPVGSPCGGGPTLPTLLASRPILGNTFTLLGRNVHAPGMVLFGVPANLPLNLGFPGCDLQIQSGTLIELLRVSSLQDWSVPVPLPDFAPLLGIELTMQAIYWPTPGPLGIDVTNGVRLRLGR